MGFTAANNLEYIDWSCGWHKKRVRRMSGPLCFAGPLRLSWEGVDLTNWVSTKPLSVQHAKGVDGERESCCWLTLNCRMSMRRDQKQVGLKDVNT